MSVWGSTSYDAAMYGVVEGSGLKGRDSTKPAWHTKGVPNGRAIFPDSINVRGSDKIGTLLTQVFGFRASRWMILLNILHTKVALNGDTILTIVPNVE